MDKAQKQMKMMLDKKRMAIVLKDNGYTNADLQKHLGMGYWQVENIITGKRKIDRRTAERLLALFGIWNVCWAMKDNGRWMPYAETAIAH